jgi:formate hydrogenlyase subunit 4
VVVVVAGASALIGVVYAIFQHELKRLLAFHSIENVGIIVLGLGACLLLHADGADEWAGVALAAALLHTLNHAVFKGLLFLGAGAFERAAGSLEIDRLGGLLQRMPWTGGAFLVGAMAIAGLPPLNGFASEWLTLQSLLAIPANGGVAAGLVGAVALGALAGTAALAVLCFVKVVGLVLLGQPRRSRVADAIDAPLPMRGAVAFLAVACVVLGVVPGALAGPLAGLAPWPTEDAPSMAVEVPWDDALPAPGIAVVLLVGTALLFAARGRRRAATAPSWACGQRLGPELAWTSAGFTKPLRLVLEGVLRPTRDISQSVRGGVLQEVRYEGHVPHLFDTHLNRPITRVGLWAAARARRVQRELDRVRGVPRHARDRSPRGRPDRGHRMSSASVAAAGAQLLGGLVLAPLIPGLVQHWKARLQGRRGPNPLQPYRELGRLWSRSGIDVSGTTFVYRLAPPVVAAALVAAVLLVPVAADAPNLGVGHSMLALGGLLALARFSVCAASWDTENGFALMGASRDLTVSVFTEAALVLSLAVAALVAGTTDLTGIVGGTAGSEAWTSPGLALGAVGFALVVLAETGRQPFDNPDTHLELTMIHEGPVLEYGGRDLALLQWGAAARHWIVLVLAAQIFVPHAESAWLQLALLPVVLVVLCGALALVETLVAKMRILLAPRLLAVGATAALLGVLTWLIETA